MTAEEKLELIKYKLQEYYMDSCSFADDIVREILAICKD